jgi:hypothetical protein
MQPMPSFAPGPVHYVRHRPETTLLYQLVERHYPDFLAALAACCQELLGDAPGFGNRRGQCAVPSALRR